MATYKSKNTKDENVYTAEPIGKTHVRLKSGTSGLLLSVKELEEQFDLVKVEEEKPKE